MRAGCLRGFLITPPKATVFKLCVFISELYRDKIDEQIPTFVPEARGEPESEL